jgi:Cytidylate kinase-like family
MSAPATQAPVVTLAALYGAAGSVIGPQVAERLGVPFLDRAIPETVAKQTGLSEAAVADVDQVPRSGVDRLTATLGRASTLGGAVGGGLERLDIEERAVRSQIEEFLARASISGGVAMGRGGMVILRSVPWALHVHLGGPPEARVSQRMALEGIDRATAEERQKVEDRTRISYVRRAYGVDGEDPALYHLMIDSTALDTDTCVELIVTAAHARTLDPRPSPPI